MFDCRTNVLGHLQQVWGGGHMDSGRLLPDACAQVPGGCSRARTLLRAPPRGAPGCRGRFIRTPLTRVLITCCTGRRPRLCLGETHAVGSQPDVRAVCTHKAPLPQGFLPTSGGTCLLDAGAHRSPPVDELETHYLASGGGLWARYGMEKGAGLLQAEGMGCQNSPGGLT